MSLEVLLNASGNSLHRDFDMLQKIRHYRPDTPTQTQKNEATTVGLAAFCVVLHIRPANDSLGNSMEYIGSTPALVSLVHEP